MSETNSPSEPTPAVPPAPAAPPAPSFTYGTDAPAQPAPPAYGAPVAYPAPAAAGGRRTWDVVLSVILFVLAVFGAGAGVIYGIVFLNPALFAQVLAEQGYSSPRIATEGPGAVILISHVLLFIVGVGLGIVLLIMKKVAFYVPLAAGVIAAIIFWVVAFQVFLSIPGFGGYR